jgi:hypothetical protein
MWIVLRVTSVNSSSHRPRPIRGSVSQGPMETRASNDPNK